MSDGTWIVRPMTDADLDRVLAIASSLRQAPQWPRDVYEAALYPASTPRRIALVAEDAGSATVVGFAAAVVVPTEAELETIVVAAEFQRKGIGRRLWRELAEILRPQGVTKVLLEVRDSNLAAKQLYGSLGFAEAGRRVGYYTDPIEDAVTMHLSLASG